MKVETVEQYKIMVFINAHFNKSEFKIELISSNCIRLTDKNNDSMDFSYSEGNEVYRYYNSRKLGGF